jgi:hypothetical protein
MNKKTAQSIGAWTGILIMTGVGIALLGNWTAFKYYLFVTAILAGIPSLSIATGWLWERKNR